MITWSPTSAEAEFIAIVVILFLDEQVAPQVEQFPPQAAFRITAISAVLLSMIFVTIAF
jgi:hypothetical protein